MNISEYSAKLFLKRHCASEFFPQYYFVLVSGIPLSGYTIVTLHGVVLSISSTQLAPYKVITIFLTVFPMGERSEDTKKHKLVVVTSHQFVTK